MFLNLYLGFVFALLFVPWSKQLQNWNSVINFPQLVNVIFPFFNWNEMNISLIYQVQNDIIKFFSLYKLIGFFLNVFILFLSYILNVQSYISKIISLYRFRYLFRYILSILESFNHVYEACISHWKMRWGRGCIGTFMNLSW